MHAYIYIHIYIYIYNSIHEVELLIKSHCIDLILLVDTRWLLFTRNHFRSNLAYKWSDLLDQQLCVLI